MPKFTVLLLYPDYLASNYGQETYLAHVGAKNPDMAVREAQRRAKEDNKTVDNKDDFFPLAVFSGHHQDLKP